MNASQRAQTAYGDARATAKSASQIEYQAFARATKDLNAARETAGAEGPNFPKLAAALHQNLKLWTVIAGDVAHEDNRLPQQLRAQLFFLAEFTIDHSKKVLRGDGDVAPLVDINTSVMRGLRGQERAEPCPA